MRFFLKEKSNIDNNDKVNLYAYVSKYVLTQYYGRGYIISWLVIASLFLTGSELLIPLFVGDLIDTITLGREHKSEINNLFLIIIGLGFFSVCFRDVIFRLIIKFTSSIMRDMTINLFSQIQRLTTEWHINNRAGSTIRKLSRGVQAIDLFNYIIFIELIPGFFILSGASLLIGMHWPIAGFAVGISILIFMLITFTLVQRYISPAAKKANSADADLNGTISDVISCNLLVKSFAQESTEDLRVNKEAKEWHAQLARFWHRSATAGSIQYVMLVGLNAILISIGLGLWFYGHATPGDVTYIITTYAIINTYLRSMENNIRNLQRSINEMEDLAYLMDEKTEKYNTEMFCEKKSQGSSISFDNVSFRYPSQHNMLYKNFNLSIQPGEKIGVVGYSGSGKTTFIKLLQRLYDIQSGTIRIDGKDIKDISIHCIRSNISIVSQEPILFHRTLLENITYGTDCNDLSEIHKAAKCSRIHDYIKSLPLGYDTVVGERGLKLSGGEKQRIALARVMLRHTPIIILDEATSNLDSILEEKIQTEITNRWTGRTLIVIAHRLSTVRQMDRILVFDNGHIVEEGNPASLLSKQGGAYRTLMENQNILI